MQKRPLRVYCCIHCVVPFPKTCRSVWEHTLCLGEPILKIGPGGCYLVSLTVLAQTPRFLEEGFIVDKNAVGTTTSD